MLLWRFEQSVHDGLILTDNPLGQTNPWSKYFQIDQFIGHAVYCMAILFYQPPESMRHSLPDPQFLQTSPAGHLDPIRQTTAL